MSIDFDSSAKKNILESLVGLSQWEWMNVPVTRTVIGRHVYFCLVTEVLNISQESDMRSLKHALNHPDYTDRAIRLKLREMERDGLITTMQSKLDKRVRLLVPTPKFVELVNAHARIFQRLLDKKFMLIEK